MRLARNLVFAALAAVAAMMLAASSAVANDTPIEIIDENTSQHCNTAGSAECHIVADSVGDITLEAFGAVRSECHNAYELELDEDGTGQIVGQTLTGPDCVTPPCGSPATPWDVLGVTEEDGELNLRANFCVVDPLFGDINCTTNVHVEVLSHRNLVADTAPPLSICEGSGGLLHVTGDWTGVGENDEQELEVVHL